MSGTEANYSCERVGGACVLCVRKKPRNYTKDTHDNPVSNFTYISYRTTKGIFSDQISNLILISKS